MNRGRTQCRSRSVLGLRDRWRTWGRCSIPRRYLQSGPYGSVPDLGMTLNLKEISSKQPLKTGSAFDFAPSFFNLSGAVPACSSGSRALLPWLLPLNPLCQSGVGSPNGRLIRAATRGVLEVLGSLDRRSPEPRRNTFYDRSDVKTYFQHHPFLDI